MAHRRVNQAVALLISLPVDPVDYLLDCQVGTLAPNHQNNHQESQVINPRANQAACHQDNRASNHRFLRRPNLRSSRRLSRQVSHRSNPRDNQQHNRLGSQLDFQLHYPQSNQQYRQLDFHQHHLQGCRRFSRYRSQAGSQQAANRVESRQASHRLNLPANLLASL